MSCALRAMAERFVWLRPARWPVRWRIAGVSAGLTLVILIAFAVVVGRLATDRLAEDFDHQITEAATNIAVSADVTHNFDDTLTLNSPRLDQLPISNETAIRIVSIRGQEIDRSVGAADLGPPRPGIREVNGYRVISVPVLQTINTPWLAYVQYGRTTASLDATTNRVWLLLFLGVTGGTALALIAGLAVAGRAMSPIANLTSAAREIATTRDPSRRVPQPTSRDEVAELAQTLDEMLRELDAARTETENMVQVQREFVADASHELGTPMTSILANLELIQVEAESLPPGPARTEIEEMLESALRSSRRMRRLISDLLILARGDAGRLGGDLDVNFPAIVAAAVNELSPVLGDHKVETDFADGDAHVTGNPDMLQGLVINLVDNARRHTPPGTTIHVGTRIVHDRVLFEVSDSGPGIPDEIKSQIFSRFVRGDGPSDRSRNGTGLGLAIVDAIAHAHGGTVELGDSPMGGAHFVVSLPLRRETDSSHVDNA